jgi:hypothetical protein
MKSEDSSVGLLLTRLEIRTLTEVLPPSPKRSQHQQWLSQCDRILGRISNARGKDIALAGPSPIQFELNG